MRISKIEISPSNRALCKNCGKFIGKGTPRGVFIGHFGIHQEKSYYCYNCIPKIVEEDVNDEKRLIETIYRKLYEITKDKRFLDKAVIGGVIK